LQIRHVDTGDQQHEEHRVHQHQHVFFGVLADQELVGRLSPEPPVLVRVGIVASQARANSAHLRRSLLHGSARLQSRHRDQQLRESRVTLFGLEHQGRPDLCGLRKLDLGGHHTDHGVSDIIQANGFSDDVRVAAEPAAPQRIGQHHHAVPAGLILARLKYPPPRGLHAQHIKEIGGRERLLDPLGLRAGARQVGHAVFETGELGQSGGLLANILSVSRSRGGPSARVVRINAHHHHHRVQIGQRNRLPQQCVGHAENGGGRSRSESHCDNGGQRKTRRFA